MMTEEEMINRSFKVFPPQECFEPEDPDDKLRDAYVRGMLDMQEISSKSEETTKGRWKEILTATGSIFAYGMILGIILGWLFVYFSFKSTGIL